jgi:elongation factor Ts
MNITAQMVKELRDATGAGMMDCKKALTESDGDMEKAMEILRQKGILSAEKKMGRIAAEGVITTAIKGDKGAMVELNCETDFVAKNDDFKELAQKLAEGIAEGEANTVEELLATNCPILGKTIEEMIKEKIATIGEKITVRRFEKYEGSLSTYVHNGKIGVMLVTDKQDEVVGKDICLHIASSAPEFLSRNDIPKEVIDEETRIEMGKEDLANKPEQIRGKIVEGRVNKLMAQKCLLEQPFVKNPDVTIQGLIEGKLTIKKFDRYVLGEGLEKRSENFAEEVMNQIKG